MRLKMARQLKSQEEGKRKRGKKEDRWVKEGREEVSFGFHRRSVQLHCIGVRGVIFSIGNRGKREKEKAKAIVDHGEEPAIRGGVLI